ncbi:MAG TPA: (5-formylfuran-3-yl)methyl phosphate synthase, partial [Methanobacterium sp.]|nr:(5-formylfuran-3-yl)methyl phosphate synthase [Methanobacterium sp.]
MLLLISPINTQEAREAINGGADIIDVKNPKEGSLGANFPWMIRNIREITPENMQVSATLGDVPYKPGTVSLAAAGAIASGADYIKVGLYGTKNYSEALEVMENVVRTVDEFNSDAIVVASGYADAHRVGAVDPMEIPRVAADSGSDLAMVDTAVKDGKTLFDFMNEETISKFTEETHNYGL